MITAKEAREETVKATKIEPAVDRILAGIERDIKGNADIGQYFCDSCIPIYDLEVKIFDKFGDKLVWMPNEDYCIIEQYPDIVKNFIESKLNSLGYRIKDSEIKKEWPHYFYKVHIEW